MDVNISELLADIEVAATNLLSQKAKQTTEIEEQFFHRAVRVAAEGVVAIYDVSIDDIPMGDIAKKLQQRFNIKMSLGTMFVDAEKYKPWLDDRSGEIDPYYWMRYRTLLMNNRFPPHVVHSLDSITDQILDHTENPIKKGRWNRKGMVVGHVQSGKTANYTGLICKAADAGYQVIIVLAGLLNALRNQTQERIDSGFIGKCTRLKEFIGAGELNSDRTPAYFTTSADDFKKTIANQIGVQIGDLKEPVVLVVKKNTSTLKNLISWLKDNNPHKLNEFPMLLIDDEADHASINTKQEGVTAINAKIRELIGLFDQSSYIGYTATPFANIFIDPHTEDDMLGDDLFPRDFILSLDPPDNYVGPEKIFCEKGDLNIVHAVDDYEDLIPLRHKKDLRPIALPASLLRAIQSFVLTRAIRLLRGQSERHNSMMINVSRFTAVQSYLRGLIEDYLKVTLKPAINNHCMLKEGDALRNSVIRELRELWVEDYDTAEFSWKEVQETLHDAVSPIGVIEVNSSVNAEPLDYSSEDYPNGRNVIAVGGLSLSRGLTLEGLTVSYFLRNSVMYDTLLQMGRWFGYRDGFADICRIYMSSEAAGWYSHISTVINELRDEFKRMKAAKMTPNEFGLCVRAHPETLIVTARNKMRSGRLIPRQIGLEGRLVETKSLNVHSDVIERNFQALETIISAVESAGTKSTEPSVGSNHCWHDVPSEIIKSFIQSIQNHPESELTQPTPLLEYIEWLDHNGNPKWDVVLCSVRNGKSKLAPYSVNGLQVRYQFRTVKCDNSLRRVWFPNRRIATVGTEQTGLTESQLLEAANLSDGETISDATYRKVRQKPLLMLHLIDCHKTSNSVDPAMFERGILGWGLSFPGQAGEGRPKKLVQYVVNTRYWEQEYGSEVEDENDIGESSD
jgi:hypothetical protein